MFPSIPKPGVLRQSLINSLRREVFSQSNQDFFSLVDNYDFKYKRILNKNLGGGNSNNILIQTNRGKKVIKRYYWSLDSLNYEHSILNYLKNWDFLSPRLECTKIGSTYTEINGRLYAIFDYLEGYNSAKYFFPDRTRKIQITRAAIALAKYHNLIFDFNPKGRKYNGFMTDGCRLWRNVSWHLNIFEHFLEEQTNKELHDELYTFLSKNSEKIRKNLVKIGTIYDKTNQQLPTIVIHGDYSPRNILFNKKDVSAVLDFGDSNLNFRALDVARGLSSFSKKGRYGISQRFSRIFVESYQTLQPLSEIELKAIPDLIMWRHLKNIIWKLNNIMIKDSSLKAKRNYLKSIRRRWGYFLWIKENVEAMRKAFYSLKKA